MMKTSLFIISGVRMLN